MPPEKPHRIHCHLDRLLNEHNISLTDLAELVGVTAINLSVLKNDRAKAIRFSTFPYTTLFRSPDRCTDAAPTKGHTLWGFASEIPRQISPP